MKKEFLVNTDTATISVFDLAAIKHRITDTPDWWSIVEDEMLEMNAGNIAFFGMGQDGCYKVSVVSDITDDFGSLYLSVPSGNVFIGAGEDATGGDLEPDLSGAIQGSFIGLASGDYLVKYKKQGDMLELAFCPSEKMSNSFEDSIRL